MAAIAAIRPRSKAGADERLGGGAVTPPTNLHPRTVRLHDDGPSAGESVARQASVGRRDAVRAVDGVRSATETR